MGANDSRLASTYGQGSEGAARDDSGAGPSSPGQPSLRRSHSEHSPAGPGNGNSPAGDGSGGPRKSRRGDAFDPSRSLFSRLLGFGSTANTPRRSHESYLSQPRSLHDRILAFQYEGRAPPRHGVPFQLKCELPAVTAVA